MQKSFFFFFLQVIRAERRAEERKCPFDTLALYYVIRSFKY